MAVKLTLGDAEVKYNPETRKWCILHPNRIVDHFCDNLALIQLGNEVHSKLILDRDNSRALIDTDHLHHFPTATLLARTHGAEVRFGS